ncbi:MAG: ATP-binding protein [Desulfamplus sp.]|nr:ATP-binding protein [Desulfamplus sp.]
MKKKLPIGIQTFSEIVTEGYYYVDKSYYAHKLISEGKHYFLSRPRRFGKSLFLDTLKELFEGNQKLFKGLYIYDKWDWSVIYPVIVIDFAGGVLQSRRELDDRICKILRSNQLKLGLEPNNDDNVVSLFEDTILNLFKKYGRRVVVLVDEYDKPIIDNIESQDVAAQMRDGLKNLYSVFKSEDAHIQFVFMTGVTKFSKVSLFSGINQLIDITLDENFSTICGYTDDELKLYFAEHLKGVDWDKLQTWYNGYKWLGDISVYNPYDLLMFIHKNFSYRNYWFETGNPNFIIKLFEKSHYFLPALENIEVTESILNSFDVEKIDPITLLFQSGYLTIDSTFTRRDRLIFCLKIPNNEVKIALNDLLIDGYTGKNPSNRTHFQDELYRSLKTGNISGITGVIERLFASIPWRNFTKNSIADSEGYYASVLYALFSSLDAQVIPEDITNHGQVDMTVKFGQNIYVVEVKLVDTDNPDELGSNPALKQIQEKKYAQKYKSRAGVVVHEVGLVFSRKLRNLLVWEAVTN